MSYKANNTWGDLIDRYTTKTRVDDATTLKDRKIKYRLINKARQRREAAALITAWQSKQRREAALKAWETRRRNHRHLSTFGVPLVIPSKDQPQPKITRRIILED